MRHFVPNISIPYIYFNSRLLQNANGPPAGGKTTYVKISTHASYKMRLLEAAI